MIQQSETIDKLVKALLKAQAVIVGAKKDSKNPFFKSDYADLTSVMEAVKAPLNDNGLVVIQTASGSEDGSGVVHVTTMLAHESGEWLRDTLIMKVKENTPQGVGSAITYGRRYGLSAITGVTPVDDDGEAATRPQKNTITKETAVARFEAPQRGATAPGQIVTPAKV